MEILKLPPEEKRYTPCVEALYRQAFPPLERKPFGQIRALQRRGKLEMLAALEQGTFAGLAMNLL